MFKKKEKPSSARKSTHQQRSNTVIIVRAMTEIKPDLSISAKVTVNGLRSSDDDLAGILGYYVDHNYNIDKTFCDGSQGSFSNSSLEVYILVRQRAPPPMTAQAKQQVQVQQHFTPVVVAEAVQVPPPPPASRSSSISKASAPPPPK